MCARDVPRVTKINLACTRAVSERSRKKKEGRKKARKGEDHENIEGSRFSRTRSISRFFLSLVSALVINQFELSIAQSSPVAAAVAARCAFAPWPPAHRSVRLYSAPPGCTTAAAVAVAIAIAIARHSPSRCAYASARTVCVHTVALAVRVHDVVYDARDHEREDVSSDGASAKERERERTCVRTRVRAYTHGYTHARVSAWQGVGAYGDPAALDEWVESQGRSEGARRESGGARRPARNAELQRASLVPFNISSDPL